VICLYNQPMLGWFFNKSKQRHVDSTLLRRFASRIAAASFEVSGRMVAPLAADGESSLTPAQSLNVVGELRLWALICSFHALQDLELGLGAEERVFVMRAASEVFCATPMFSRAEIATLPGSGAPPELQLYDMPPSRSLMVQTRYDWCSNLVEQSRNDPGRIPPAIMLQILKWTMIEHEEASGDDLIAITLAASSIRKWAYQYLESAWRDLRPS
jgi:hypothetical protein